MRAPTPPLPFRPSSTSLTLAAVSVAAALFAACGGSTEDAGLSDANPPSGAGNGGAAGSGPGSGGAGSGPGGDAFPCEIATFLASRCLGCHSEPPTEGVPMALTTPGAFTQPSTEDGKTVAQLSVERLHAGAGIMPPKPEQPASAEEVATFEAWVAAGLPSGTCTSEDGGPIKPSPFDVPETCTSNTTWKGGNKESPLMHPGVACIQCHTEKKGPRFAFAGTVFPTAHEPDDCNGANKSDAGTGAVVEVTDANGKVYTMKVNAVGNFYSSAKGVAMPYTAVVRVGDSIREMTTPADTGDCNSCHTQDGTNDAPGRIVLP
jgi:hypothetical protein